MGSVRSIVGFAVTVWVAFNAAQTTLYAQTTNAKLPPKLEEYLAKVVQPTAEERQQLLSGQPLAKTLEANPDIEVAVFGATWVKAPIRAYVNAVRDIENFERGQGFLVTKRISSPPKIEDFSRMRVPTEDLDDIGECSVGDCNVKLGEEAIRRFQRQVDWNGPNRQTSGNSVMRQIALEYVKGYLEGGNDRLAVYKDQDRPTFVAQEFRSMVDNLPALTTFMPEMRSYLLDYPKVKLPNSTSFLYWQEVEFGLKPLTRISHFTIRETPSETVVASKMLYASHYFWTALELRVLVPDPARGTGFWLFTVSRSRSDGLSGFLGRIIGMKVRSEAAEGTLSALKATKSRLER